MNRYGQMARAHWAKCRPAEYAQMGEGRTTFFWNLGEQIESRIEDRADALERAIPPDLPFQDRMERMRAARPMAEREVLEEMLPRAEEDDEASE